MRTLAVLLVAIALSACSMAPASRTNADFRSDRLTAGEIARTPHRDVLSAIQTLRPRFLNARGLHSSDMVTTYLDGVRVGGPSILASLPTETVLEVRHLSAIEATTRYGAGHSAGAILVTTVGNRPW